MTTTLEKLKTTIEILLKNKQIDVVSYALLYKFIHGTINDYYDQYESCIEKLNDLYEKNLLNANDIIDFIKLGTKLKTDDLH